MKSTNLLILLIFFLSSCNQYSNDYDYVRSAEWILEKGHVEGVGENIFFDTSGAYKILGDTLFFFDRASGIISEVDTNNGFLVITSLAGNECGTWVDLSKKYKY